MGHLPPHIQLGYQIEAKGKTPSLIKQVHQNGIYHLKPHSSNTPPPEADALLTHEPDTEIHIFTADCVPVLLFTNDPNGPIAAIHSGWRSTRLNIVPQTIEQMDTSLVNLHAWVGPCICKQCYEVGNDVIEDFKAHGHDISKYLTPSTNQKAFLDLVGFVVGKQLEGIPKENLHLNEFTCSYCSTPKLPSYRRDKITDPRIRSWIRKSYTP